MKIKILHILHSLHIGGLENGVVNLINHLDNDKFRHAICCISSSGAMAERLEQPVEIFSLNKGNEKDYLLLFKIAKVIRKVRPHIVHTRNWAAIDGVIGAKLAGVKFIIHGEHGREATDPAGANLIRRKIRKGLNPFISGFVTVSHDLRRWLINDVGIPEKKVIQIINGVDTNKFAPQKNKKSLREKFGFDADAFLIGTVGRLDPVKDQKTLINALAVMITHSQNKKIKLMIAGSGPEEQEFKKMAAEIGVEDRIYFLGERSDIPELMQSMDVFVLPSIAEGVSNTILEAMACGLPIVASRVGGNHELIDYGKTGFLFVAGDYKELAGRLSFYLNNYPVLIEHGNNGRKRTEELFSLQRMVGRYEELYCSVFNREHIRHKNKQS